MRAGVLRVALGTVLLGHGLGNAVLQLRGIDAATPDRVGWLSGGLAVTAIIGFSMAGLAVLGVRPLRALAVPAAAAAGAAGFTATLLPGLHALPDLWPGALLSALLPLATWLWSHRTEPPARPHHWTRVLVDTAGLALLTWVVASAVLWPWHRSWGATPAEWRASLPGDRSPRLAGHEILHAVTIDAPPSAVWRWLVQLGQDRAGFYSYERLERLAGADIHNIREIRPEWQHRRAGDVVYATQAGYLGGLFGVRPGWTVDLVEPNRALVLRYWGAFVLQPTGDGRTRFLIRSTISNPEIPVWAAALNFVSFELPHFIMQRRMMLGIKELAESAAALRSRQ